MTTACPQGFGGNNSHTWSWKLNVCHKTTASQTPPYVLSRYEKSLLIAMPVALTPRFLLGGRAHAPKASTCSSRFDVLSILPLYEFVRLCFSEAGSFMGMVLGQMLKLPDHQDILSRYKIVRDYPGYDIGGGGNMGMCTRC